MKSAISLTAALVFFTIFSGRAFSQMGPDIQALLDSYKKSAGVSEFSAAEGKKFFNSRRVHSVNKEERSCSACHTVDPTKQGKTPVGKVIEPMAPSVNKERFTDPKKVEKWFKRNCEYVLERECTPREKGDFITYMFSI